MIMGGAGASRLRRWARRAPAPASRLGLDLGRHRPDIDQYGREVHLRRKDDRLVRASLLEATLRRWQETGQSPVATSCAACGYAWTRKVELPHPTERSSVCSTASALSCGPGTKKGFFLSPRLL